MFKNLLDDLILIGEILNLYLIHLLLCTFTEYFSSKSTHIVSYRIKICTVKVTYYKSCHAYQASIYIVSAHVEQTGLIGNFI